MLENSKLWEWEPEMYNPAFGCWCLELHWLERQLVFMYKEKHDIYIAVVDNGQVKCHSFYGEKYKLTPNKLIYQTYSQSNRDLVTWLDVPSLEQVEEIEWRGARQLNLEPEAMQNNYFW